ncbi:MAG: TolC family protein [Bacteroidales bacterium]|nr:TolC family protein [Candidatus Colimorpha onthohippi]
MYRFVRVFLVFMVLVPSLYAQPLSLQDCRDRALKSNNQIKLSHEKNAEAEALRGQAVASFFPKISANGIYTWNQKNIALLSDNQAERISSLGTTLSDKITPKVTNLVGALFQNGDLSLASVVALQQLMGSGSLASDLNGIGQEIVDALDFDMHNIFVGAVSLSQPIYVGGKLRAFYNLSQLSVELAGLQYDKQREDVLISVDEAYWRVISLQHKLRLAQQYHTLLTDLNRDVDAMLEAEVATKGDQAKVRVKLNEAQMSLTRASGGLALAKMLLAQRCGMPLDADFQLVEDSSMISYESYPSINMDNVFSLRKEIKMLDLAQRAANAKVRLAAAELKPNILASASYMVSNPNFYNGYNKTTAGMFSTGLIVNVPICNPSACFALKVAKHKRNEASIELEDAKSKITLQVNQFNYELEVANKKLSQAQSNLEHANENLKLARESFAAGLISSSDLLSAQTAWLSAHSDVIDADIEVRMSYLYLRQAMGLF